MHGSRGSLVARPAAARGAHAVTVRLARAAVLAGVLAASAACSSSKTATTPSTQATTAPASSTSAAAQTTTSQGGSGTSIRGPIPDSAAIDAVTRDLTSPRALELTARCGAFVTAFRANAVAPGNEATVMRLLGDLAGVVRPIDPAVADALAGHAGAAAAWCKAKGFTKD